MIYLDNNATTEPASEVISAVEKTLRENWGNPSSTHQQGMLARQCIEQARESIARLLGCGTREVILTSCGTESCNLALAGSLGGADGRKVIVTTRYEHSAVREYANALAAQGNGVVWIDGGKDGLIDPQQLEQLLSARAREIAIVSIMWANNETGLVQPIAQLASICRRHGVRFHTDATQWVGRMPTNVADLEIDLLSCSAHKFHGPKGIAALFCRRGITLRPLIIGGPQERDRRGGTENVAAIVGMGVAADLAHSWLTSPSAHGLRLAALRDKFEQLVCASIASAVVQARDQPRLWNTSNIAFVHLEAEAVLVNLARHGLAASAGAACSSGSLDPSPVLLAMGIPPEIAHGAVRFSLSRNTTEAEIVDAARIVIESVRALARSMP